MWNTMCLIHNVQIILQQFQVNKGKPQETVSVTDISYKQTDTSPAALYIPKNNTQICVI